MNKAERLVSLGTIIILIILLFMKECGDKHIIEQLNMYSTINDSTKHYKDKYGIEHATNIEFEASNAKILLSIKSKDSLIIQLQQKVKEYKDKLGSQGSVTTVDGVEIVHTTSTTTVTITDSTKCFPTYSSIFKNKWLDYEIIAKSDTIKLDLEIKNDYTVVIGEQRDKWYKKKVPFVDVSNENPYDKIKSVKSFQVRDNVKRKFSLGIQFGYGFDGIGLPKPYIGIGGQFNILNL